MLAKELDFGLSVRRFCLFVRSFLNSFFAVLTLFHLRGDSLGVTMMKLKILCLSPRG